VNQAIRPGEFADFRDINVMDVLSDAEIGDVLNPSSLLARMEARRHALDTGMYMPWAKLHDRFMLRPAEVCLLGGYSGHFKSTISNQIAISALHQGFKVGIASLELPAEDVMESLADIAATHTKPPMGWINKFANWADNKLFIYDRVDGISPESAVQLTIAFRKFFGCDLVILDALMMMGVCQDTEREQQFTQTINAVAKKMGICVLLIHHMRKPDGQQGEQRSPGKYDFIGSSHIANIAQSILISWHDKDKAAKVNVGQMDPDEDRQRPDLKLSIVKQRNARFEGTASLWQHKDSRAFCATPMRLIKPFEFHSDGSLRTGWEPLQ